MRVTLLIQNLCLAWLAPREICPIEVQLPIVEAKGYRRVGCQAGSLTTKAEERAEHDVGGCEAEEGKDAKGALAGARGREGGPALPRAED